MTAPMSTEAQFERYTLTVSLYATTGMRFIDSDSKFFNLLLLQQLNQMQALSNTIVNMDRTFWKLRANQKAMRSVITL